MLEKTLKKHPSDNNQYYTNNETTVSIKAIHILEYA